MNQISGFCRIFLLVFLFSAPVLRAEETPPTSSTQTIVESVGNTGAAKVALVLSEVVITADRLKTPASQVASSISVITKKDMEQKQAMTALTAIQGVPGLTLLQNGAPGENAGIFVRGADAGHTLVLLDGVPINNAMSTSRGFDSLDQLFTDDIEQIEVVRGPLSTVYGTNATAGVVNIITQKAGGAPSGSFLFEGGAYHSFREGLSASAGNDWGNVALSLSHFDTQGFPSADKSFGNLLNNSDANTTASLRMGLVPGADLENNLLVRFVQSRVNVPAIGGAGGDDPNYFLDERQWMVGNQTQWKLLNGNWEQVLGLSFTNDLQKFTDDFSSYPYSHYERGVFEGQSAQVNWQNNFKLWQRETLVVGFQGQQEWGRQDDTTDYGGGPSPTLIDKSMTTGSIFIENQTGISERLFVTLGGRFDAVSSFASQFSYRGAAAYFVPGLETKLKATYGTGFKVPSIYQLYSPYGDPALLTEASRGWDAGFEQTFGSSGIEAGATYFHNDFTDLIDYDAGIYKNISKARTEGWETFVTVKPLKGLEFRTDYTYTWALNVQTGQQLLRRPQSRADFSATYQWDKANLGLSVVYVGERPDLDFATFPATPLTLPSYAVVNLTASYQIDKGVKLFGRVNNLFDTVYEQVYGYGTPGLSIYAGTKLSI